MGTQLLESVTPETAGVNRAVLEYLTPRLFEPLGFGPVFWDSSPQGINTGGWGFMVTLEDIAKLGLLYLNRGKWQGKQLLSKTWTDEAALPHADNSITPGSSADWTRGYGYQFWRSRYGFRGDGAFGQYCLVLPEFDAVLALSSETENMQELLDIIWNYLPSVFNTVNEGEERRIHGREFRVSGTAGVVDSVVLTFYPDRLVLVFKTRGTLQKLEAGRFGWLEGETRLPLEGYSFIPLFSMAGGEKKVSASFLWRDKGELEIRIVYRTGPHREILSLSFEGDSLRMVSSPNRAVRATGRPGFEFRGVPVKDVPETPV
jgi:hypothetical protein